MSYSFGAWCQAGRNIDLLLYFIIIYLFIYLYSCNCRLSLLEIIANWVHSSCAENTPCRVSTISFWTPYSFRAWCQPSKKKFNFIILYLYSWNCRWSLSEIIVVWIQSSCEKKTCRVTTVSLWTPCYPWSEAIQATGKIPTSDVLCLNNATLMLLLFPCFIL